MPVDDLTKEIDKKYKDCLKDKGIVIPTSRFNTRIDYIFTNCIENVINAEVLNVSASDHKPVICDIL